MIFDSIQFVLWLGCVGWWLIRRKRYGDVEKILLMSCFVAWWSMSVIERVADNNAGWAALNAFWLALFLWWLIDDVIDYFEGKAAEKRWAKYDVEQALFRRQAQAWMHGEDWRDVK